MRIIHWAAVLGTGATLRSSGAEREPAAELPGLETESMGDARAAARGTGPLAGPR